MTAITMHPVMRSTWQDGLPGPFGQPLRTRTKRCSLGYAHLRLEAGVYPWRLDRTLGGVALLRVRATRIIARLQPLPPVRYKARKVPYLLLPLSSPNAI